MASGSKAPVCTFGKDSLFGNILQLRVAHDLPKKHSMRSHNHNSAKVTEEPESEIKRNVSTLILMKDSAVNAGETNRKNEERKSGLNMAKNAKDNAIKPPKISVVFPPNCSPGKTNVHLPAKKLLFNKDNFHIGQGDMEKSEVGSIQTYQVNPRFEANKNELNSQPAKIADTPEDTPSSNAISRRYGRILRRKNPIESDRFENKKTALTPVRPKEKKPDKLRNLVMARSLKRNHTIEANLIRTRNV